MKLRLSGWARLWIVIVIPIWAIATWFSVAAETERWRADCNWNGCPNYFEAPREDLVRAGANPAELIEPTLDQVRSERGRRERVTAQHNERLLFAYTSPALGAFVAFLVAILSKSAALWVWRGFRKED